MPSERDKKTRKKKDTVRFILVKPRPSERLKLSTRLFHPGKGESLRSLRTRALPLEDQEPNLSASRRFAAALIAAVLLLLGLAMILSGVRNDLWLIVLIGPFSIWYGLAWLRTAYAGRLPGGRLRLNPWSKE